MKEIFYTDKSGVRQPFWKPWGAGCFGRLLLFLLLMFVFFFLLSLIRQCDRDTNRMKPDPDIPAVIVNPGADTTGTPGSGEPGTPGGYGSGKEGVPPAAGIPGQIDNPGPHLPPSDRNIIPPVADDDIIDDRDNGTRIAANRLNVMLNSTAGDEVFKAFAEGFKKAYPGDEYKIVYYSTLTKLIQLEVPSAMRETVKSELPGKIPDISFKVFDETIFDGAEAEKPSDIGFLYNDIAWYFAPIQAYEAWEITRGSEEVTIAIVDSYFDMTHSELESSRVMKPYSVRFRSSDVRPTLDCPPKDGSFYHGTAVATLAAGAADNGTGLCGIAPGCSIMPISLGHQLTSMKMLEGLLYAVYQGADVVNLSMGTAFSDKDKFIPIREQIRRAEMWGVPEADVWQYAFDLADERNVTIVWAAGNHEVYSGQDYSKRGKNTVRVAAVDRRLQRAWFSNFGNIPEFGIFESTVSAPGTDMLLASPFNSYAGLGPGTSFAAPVVAGAIGLMKSVDPSLTNAQIIEILQKTGRPVEKSPEIGPLLQIRDALLCVKGQFSDFDDIKKNRDSLVGTWQATDILGRIQERDTIYNAVKVYFQFSSPSEGAVRLYEFNTTGNVYSAPLDIRWEEDRIVMNSSMAMSPDDTMVYSSYDYRLVPDHEGLMMCLRYDSGESSPDTRFYIKKISDDPEINIREYE